MSSILSNYYYKDLKKYFKILIPQNSKIFITYEENLPRGKYDYIILVNALINTGDAQQYVRKLRKHTHSKTRIIVIYFNFLWKPLLDLASKLGLRKTDLKEPNWFSSDDIRNILLLEGYEQVKMGRRFLVPLNLPLISNFINKFVSQLPLINLFCLSTYQIFRLVPAIRDYSVSIVIPARNEEGNMKGVLKKIPKMGTRTEVIFVEGGSKDNTFNAIGEEIRMNTRKDLSASLFKQKGKGKGDAVRLGFSKAKNEMLMILDADLTVDPKDLPKFYSAISRGLCEFANGSRLVYPMQKQAMRNLNYLGNKIFGTLFSYILGQRVKDTLCGTKAILKEDYLSIEENRKYFGEFDPFGDFDLLFGAARLNLKIADIPIRYGDRTYGSTNISRYTHGLLLIRMTLFAACKIKFI